MAPIAMVFGVLLSVLGIGFFGATGFDWSKATALIPVAFGIVFVALGVLGRDESKRMHAMHGAALVGLIGLVMPLVMGIRALSNPEASSLAIAEQFIMAGMCGVFVGLCVKSFIDIRIARKQKEASESKAP